MHTGWDGYNMAGQVDENGAFRLNQKNINSLIQSGLDIYGGENNLVTLKSGELVYSIYKSIGTFGDKEDGTYGMNRLDDNDPTKQKADIREPGEAKE